MTVSNQIAQTGPYTANGVQTVFDRTFKITDAAHLAVQQIWNGSTTTITSGFSQTGVGSDTGTITFTTPPPSGAKITLYRNVPFEQQSDYTNEGKVPPEVIETDLDLIVMMVQALKSQVSLDIGGIQTAAEQYAAQAAASAAILTASTDVYVEAFGAVGDGATDCTAAVQAAIDYVAARIASTGSAASKVYVNFGPGVFVCGQLTIKQFVTLRGSGVSATEIKLKDGTDDHLIISPDFATLTGTDVCLPGEGVINNIGFEKLRINGNKANNTAGDGIRVIAKNIWIDDVVIQSCAGNGLYTELGLQCPLNDWDILVEGKIDGLVTFENDGHGWHQRGPHDQFIAYMKSYLNGGDGWRIENNGGSYTAPTDFMHVHSYSNVGKGLNIIGNNSVKGRFLRVENNDEEGLYIPSANNCHFGFVSALDNCQVSTANQVYVAANYCTIDQLRTRRAGRAGAINGIEIAGNSNVVNASCFGDVTGGGFSTGIGIKITGSYNSVRGTCEEWQSGTALSTAGNYNDVQITTQNANVSWTHTQGTGSKFKITGSGKNGGTLKAGDALNTSTNLETGDVFLRETGTATTYVLP